MWKLFYVQMKSLRSFLNWLEFNWNCLYQSACETQACRPVDFNTNFICVIWNALPLGPTYLQSWFNAHLRSLSLNAMTTMSIHLSAQVWSGRHITQTKPILPHAIHRMIANVLQTRNPQTIRQITLVVRSLMLVNISTCMSTVFMLWLSGLISPLSSV